MTDSHLLAPISLRLPEEDALKREADRRARRANADPERVCGVALAAMRQALLRRPRAGMKAIERQRFTESSQ